MNDQTVLKNDLSEIDASAGRLERRHDARNAENERLAAVVAAGLAPSECGPEMVSIAPARGRVIPFRSAETYLDAGGEFQTIDHGAYGRSAMRERDVFDVMIDKASKKKGAPFTYAQVQMGRDYRDLVERHASAGVRCSSVEGMPSGGGGDGTGYMDAVIDQGKQIDHWRKLIGNGLAMEIRRVRPSKRGERVVIKARKLVDMVCIEGKTISQVLHVHGWKIGGPNVTKLSNALCECLDRMAGTNRKGGIVSATYGVQSMADIGYEPVLGRTGEMVAGRYQRPHKGVDA